MHAVDKNNQTNGIMRWWDRLQRYPAGAWLFSFFLGRYAPYSGSISARVEALSPGHARVSIRDRKKVRNHLKSIHAIALINLGEIATGLAVLTTIADNMRGIVLGLEAEYLKKARGKLVANAEFELPQEIDEQTPVKVTAELFDQSGEVVTRVHATWLLGFR
jgi:acyl-coenzyme A thioesterase PaaI-like protein